MGCKCANQTEDEEEIEKKTVEEGKEEKQYNSNNDKNFYQNEHLLGLNNQDNFHNEIQNNLNNINNEINQDNENTSPNENNNNDQHNNYIDPNEKYADYPEKIVELINTIREDPVTYADTIEESIQNITEVEDKNNPGKNRLIYKKKVKVALNRGEPAFREAAEVLRSMSPLPPLEFKNEICVPLPENEDEFKDPKFLREQVKIIREENEIDVFFKDLIKIPEVSGLLMIVDDSNKNAGKKRMALLNKDLKYVGVTSKFVGKHFVAFLAFSK